MLFAVIAAPVLYNVISVFNDQAAHQNFIVLLSDMSWAAIPAGFAFLAALILSRQPNNTIGWLLMLIGISLATDIFKNYFNSLAAAPEAPSPAFILALWFTGWSWMLFIFPTFYILLLFPNGRLASPRWRWVNFYILSVFAFFFIVIAFEKNLVPDNGAWSMINPLGFIPIDWVENYSAAPFLIGLLSTTVLSVVSIVARYRQADAVVREQIKWLLYASSLFAAFYILTVLFNINSETWGSGPSLPNLLLALGALSLPVAIAISILRYRLWDIDVIIRRTLVYSILTAILALVYFGGVTLLQGVLSGITGEHSTAAIVLSTLTIAALFSPLRKRMQEFIDHRFYRRKYNAEKTLQAFSESLREQVDLDELNERLITIVNETLQPENVGLMMQRGMQK
jgi:MFS family permease